MKKTGLSKKISRKELGKRITAAILVVLAVGSLSFSVSAASDIHYISLKSEKTGEGSNFNNDGAKADDSMVIGISSTSEGINSTVIGNNNKLTGNTSYIGDDGKAVKVNNSIVAGQNLEVDGYSNTVFATEAVYDMYQRQTKVAGDHNTVIGAGNLVGYSEEDSENGYTYTKLGQGISSNKNVVIGTRQTVSGSNNVAVGYLTEFEVGADQVTTMGIENHIGSEAREGVAIGNHLGINGYQTVAIGFQSQANAKNAMSIGQQSSADAENSVAIGVESQANAKNAMSIGQLSEADVEGGVALGSGSMANREAGMSGYLSEGKTSAEWKSTLGALSVGAESDKGKDTRQITGVAAGTKDTDAVNVAQLKRMDSKIGTLNTKVNRAGAGAAALAGLHPLDYDPDNKFDFAAGYGNYKGANALAIGAFYRPDENKMISIGGSFGGGENMVSAGVSVKLGQGTGISTSKVAMAKEIKNLKIENERMQEENREIKKENREIKQEIEVLKEQMQKLLAGK